MPDQPPPVPICERCGGSGCEPPPRKVLATSKQRRLLAEHAFDRHELFKLMDRVIARQVIPLEFEWAKPDGARMVDLLEEASIHIESALVSFTKASKHRGMRSLFYAATNLVFTLETLHFSPHHLESEGDADDE